MKILLSALALLFAQLAQANPSVFYFTEKDGDNRSIFYKAMCAQTKSSGSYCSLKSIAISNSKSSLKCGMAVETLYEWDKATRAGDTWIISSSQGACGYTNTYQIAETGMVQVKSAPKKKKFDLCEVFEPKTYKMQYHADVSDIRLTVAGCDALNILSLN